MADASSLPKYIQISEMLIREIAAGHLADGARLPPERDMAAELGISVGTLRKALGDLSEKGMLERVQGSGNYVRHRTDVASVYALFRLELLGGGGLPTARVLAVDRLEKEAGMRAFGPSTQAHRIRRVRLLDDIPVAIEEIWLDGSYRETVMAQDLAWADAAFDLQAGALAGYVERVSFDTRGQPAEFSRTWFDYNKARYISRLGKG